MTAWVRGSKLDAGSFASHFFGRAADDPVVATLRAAVSEASFATTHAQLAKASGDLADAMKAVGLDSWPRFVVDAQARARDPATVAAIEKSLQPPDLNKDAITPVYPVEKELAVAAAGVTGGAAGLLGSAARAVAGAVASKILGDASAPAGTEPSPPPGPAKEVVPEKPVPPTNSPDSLSPAGDTGAVADPALVDYMNHMNILPGTDCSEIAESIQRSANGSGSILHITPAAGKTLSLMENGALEEGFVYHDVFTDGAFAYDPRFGQSPVPLSEYLNSIQRLNLGLSIVRR